MGGGQRMEGGRIFHLSFVIFIEELCDYLWLFDKR
jgi:hypothetical protein